MNRPYVVQCLNMEIDSLFYGISFTLTRGALCIVQGSNGSGKSSLLKLLAGEIPHSHGALSWGDEAVKEGEDKPIKPLYLCESRSVQLSRTVRKQAEKWARACRNHTTVDAALHYFDLTEKAEMKCRDLSYGWQQRLILTQLLINPSPIWLLDDPFQGLDEEGTRLVQSLIQTRVEQGGTVMMVVRHSIQNGSLAIIDMDDYAATSQTLGAKKAA